MTYSLRLSDEMVERIKCASPNANMCTAFITRTLLTEILDLYEDSYGCLLPPKSFEGEDSAFFAMMSGHDSIAALNAQKDRMCLAGVFRGTRTE